MTDAAKKISLNIPDVMIPMDPDPNHPDNKSSVGVMGRFMRMVKNRFKTDLQAEFAANATRPALTEEDELNPEKSHSFLPTVGRALKNTLPTLLGGFFSMLAELLNSLLGLFFKIEKPTQDIVTTTVKAVGKGLFSDNPGEGLQNIATNAAPVLMKGLNDMLGLGLTADEMKATTTFPKSATFTPKAKNETNNPGIYFTDNNKYLSNQLNEIKSTGKPLDGFTRATK